MGTLCEPKCQLSLCDNDVKIATSTVPLFLKVWKSNVRLCDIELIPKPNNDIVLSNDDIIDFGAEGTTFKIQLRDSNNEVVEIMYKDCNGTDKLAESIRLSFNECETQNDVLNEIC